MARNMTKIAAFLLALAFMCAFSITNAWAATPALTIGTTAEESEPVGFADIPANPSTIALDEKKTVTVANYEEVVTFAFVPRATGDYYFASEGSCDTAGCVVSSGKLIISNDTNPDRGTTSENFKAYFHGEAGATYYLQTRVYETGGSFTVKVAQGAPPIGLAYLPDNPESIALDEKKQVTVANGVEVATFAFTPRVSGDYYFTSEGNCDTEGCVIAAGKLVVRNDYSPDRAPLGDNFKAYFHGEAGETYYLQAGVRDETGGSFTVVVAQGAPIVGYAYVPDNPESISLDDEKDVTLKGCQIATYVFQPKSTAKCNAEAYLEDYNPDIDTEVCVFTEQGFINESNSDFGECATFFAEAGETYYIQARICADEAPGTVPIKIHLGEWRVDRYKHLDIMGAAMLKEGENDTYSLVSDLPAGMEYDVASNTLTLTNCTLDASGMTEVYNGILGSDLTIVLKGDNVFKGFEGGYATGISSEGELRILGDGSLTMDFSKTTYGSTGIFGYNGITIDGPTINIIGGDKPKAGTFYGIGTAPWENYYVFKNAKDLYHVAIKNADVSISNTCSNSEVDSDGNPLSFLNVGIDTQDCDLIINNSRVQVTMTGGSAWGLCTGLTKGSGSYGGKLSIDDASWVTIKSIDISDEYVRHGTYYSLYYYEDDVYSPYIYVGDSGKPATLAERSVIQKHTWVNSRSECTNAFLEFAPREITHDNPVIPGDPGGQSDPAPAIVLGDVTGDKLVAMNDILKINSYLLKRIELTGEELTAADVTGDGYVAMNDILKINSYLLKRIPSLEAA